MNVREMLEEIPRRYPQIEIEEEKDYDGSWTWFRLKFPSGWLISCGYGRNHCCDTRLFKQAEHKDSETVEIAIFRPNGDWYVAEGMGNIVEYSDGTKSGVFGWKTDEELFEIIDYLSQFPTENP